VNLVISAKKCVAALVSNGVREFAIAACRCDVVQSLHCCVDCNPLRSEKDSKSSD